MDNCEYSLLHAACNSLGYIYLKLYALLVFYKNSCEHSALISDAVA
jgi:hypothetical protein